MPAGPWRRFPGSPLRLAKGINFEHWLWLMLEHMHWTWVGLWLFLGCLGWLKVGFGLVFNHPRVQTRGAFRSREPVGSTACGRCCASCACGKSPGSRDRAFKAAAARSAFSAAPWAFGAMAPGRATALMLALRHRPASTHMQHGQGIKQMQKGAETAAGKHSKSVHRHRDCQALGHSQCAPQGPLQRASGCWVAGAPHSTGRSVEATQSSPQVVAFSGIP